MLSYISLLLLKYLRLCLQHATNAVVTNLFDEQHNLNYDSSLIPSFS